MAFLAQTSRSKLGRKTLQCSHQILQTSKVCPVSDRELVKEFWRGIEKSLVNASLTRLNKKNNKMKREQMKTIFKLSKINLYSYLNNRRVKLWSCWVLCALFMTLTLETWTWSKNILELGKLEAKQNGSFFFTPVRWYFTWSWNKKILELGKLEAQQNGRFFFFFKI